MAHSTRSKATVSTTNKDSRDPLKDLLTSFLVTEATSDNLADYSKEDLIQLVLKLQDENSTLKEEKLFMERTDKRLEDLERSHNLHFLYGRRDSVEITGIPINIPYNGLEDDRIFDHAKVKVNGTKLDKLQKRHAPSYTEVRSGVNVSL